MSEQIKTLTVRLPEPIHSKLRIIAALQKTSMSGAVIHLIEKETVKNIGDVEVLKSLLYSESTEKVPQMAEKAPQEKTSKRKPEVDI